VAQVSRETTRYILAVLGYIALGFATKEYLTFTWGLIYFMLVLELMPRTYRRFRRWLASRDEVAPTNEVAQ
jgi:hypothetical protein